MSLMEHKQTLRQQMRRQRQNLTHEQVLSAAIGVSDQLDDLLADDDYPLAIYLSFDNELDTGPFINRALTQDRIILLPVLQAKGCAMRFKQYQQDMVLEENRYGIGEPVSGREYLVSECQTICLPLTAFDRQGGRIGMGGGYYDVTLASFGKRTQNTNPKLLGLGYEFQELPECPMEAHDQRLDCIVTPSEIIEINR